MSDPVDKRLFAELGTKSHNEIIFPPFCDYDPRDKCYIIKAWGGEYLVYPDRGEVQAGKNTAKAHDYFYVFLVNYLLSPKLAEPALEWLSVKDLVGGVTFFRGPHEIPTEAITQAFGNDIESLQEKCRTLGGTPLAMADCAFSFDVVGSIRVALLYWLGDEDFPPEAKLLVDQTVADTLKLDVVYGLLCDACMRIGR